MAQIALVPAADFFIEKQPSMVAMPAMHYHHTFEIYYLVKGEREYFIENQFFKVREGDMVIIPKGMLHRTAGKGGMRYLAGFSKEFLRRFFTPAATEFLRSKCPFVFRPDEAHADRLAMLMSALLTEFQRAGHKTGTDADSVIAGYLYQVLFTAAYTPNTYVAGSYTDDRITKIIRYINDNYNHINDIEEIADRFFISKYHLCRTFNKNLGIPLVTYLNTIKIREACRMMKTQSGNLTEIAMKCGFNSSSYFCKVFKNEKGISPREYKRQLKQSK